MSKPDLDTVAMRRNQIASEIAGLEKMRLELDAEDQDLVVAERVLQRLAAIPVAANAPESAETRRNA